MRHHQVAALALGGIKRRIRCLDQNLRALPGARPQHRDTDADGDVTERRGGVLDGERGDVLAHPLGGRARADRVAARQQHVDAIASALKSFLSRPPPIVRTAAESTNRPISVQTAERWNPATLDQLRVQQRDAIIARMQQLRLHKTAFACGAVIQPPLKTSLRAIGSVLISASSILAGPALFGAVQGMQGAPDSVSLMRMSYLVWLLAALLGAGMGIAALLSIHRSANRMHGFRRAWTGTGLGVLMAILALLAFAGTSVADPR